MLCLSDLSPFTVLRGRTRSGRLVQGTWVRTHPGRGFVIKVYTRRTEYEQVLILNDIQLRSATSDFRMQGDDEQRCAEETDHRVNLSTRSVLFWLHAGVPVKTTYFPQELELEALVEPYSARGLEMEERPYPILRPEVFRLLPHAAHVPDEEFPDNLSADVRYFLDTGKELLPLSPGDAAPVPLLQRIIQWHESETDAWHLARAAHFRRRAAGEGQQWVKHFFGENNWFVYLFQDMLHSLLYITSKSTKIREIRMACKVPKCETVCVPGHSPAPAFVLREPPSFIGLTISPIGSRRSSMSVVDAVGALTDEELREDRVGLEKQIQEAQAKLAELEAEEQRRSKETNEQRVKRLSREDLEEALEEAHHTMKSIWRNWKGSEMPQSERDILETTQNWCTAAYRELATR